MALNLKQKSFIFVAVAVALLLVVYVGLSQYSLNQITSRHKEDRMQRTDAAGKSIDDFFARAAKKLETIGGLPLLLNGLQSLSQTHSGKEIPTSDTLHYLVFKSDIFTDGVYLLNEHGKVLWSEPRDQEILNTDYPLFNPVRDSFKSEFNGVTFTIGDGPNRNTEVLVASTLLSQDGSLVGYLVGAIPATHEAITSAIGATLSPAVKMQLVTSDGLVIASTDEGRVMRQLEYREPVLEGLRNAQQGVLGPATLKSIIAYRQLETAPYFVASDESESAALKEINDWKAMLTGIGILSMTAIMATLIFVVRSFTRPVELLTEDARRISAGNLDVQFGKDRHDEIGVLAKTLDDMKARLRSSYDRLLQSEKMALMGQVVAGIAHELNNPLTIVIGHTELMMLKGVDELQKQPLNRIHDGAERASKIVKNLLTFARQRKPERKLSDINSIILKTIELRSYELKVSNIELVTALAPNLPMTLCDPHQLQQVILNLIVNAEHAMIEAHGKGRLKLRSTLQPGHIRIDIEDNGPGISVDNLRRVFDPFFTTKAVGKGTGLGLSICQGIVAEHGGQLNVASTVGVGATFTVELPLLSEAMLEPPSAASPQTPAGPRARRILVVDDEDPMRELFIDILRADGHEVVTAANGHQGLDAVSRSDFDLIIADIKMPDLDGPAFYEELKRTHPLLATRMMFMTGDLMNPSTIRFLETCGLPWLSKPFEIQVVREAVRRNLAA